MKDIFPNFINFFRNKAKKFPDKRVGSNSIYKIEDITLSAFSVFHMQSPSFLQFQKDMERNEGKSNAQSLFGLNTIPSDNHIRNILDSVSATELSPMYDKQLNYLKDAKILNTYKYMGKYYPIALDGTQYYSSKKISCEKCLIRGEDEDMRYSHQVVTPIIVSPFKTEVIPLMPEFIRNEDGTQKQDCEINASKRWLKREIPLSLPRLLLGDDLYAHEPFCRKVIENKDSFVFVAKETSHQKMYEFIEYIEKTVELESEVITMGKAHKKEIWKYTFLNTVPINGHKDALEINWLKIEVYSAKTEKRKYYNTFITDIEISTDNIHDIGRIGRTRWKVENENNNTLKTKGYHLEHNFGHGKEHLSELLTSMNILAFLFHTVLGLLDENYRKSKAKRTRERFFNEIEIFTSYIYFPSWEVLMKFMSRGRDSPLIAISDLMDISELEK